MIISRYHDLSTLWCKYMKNIKTRSKSLENNIKNANYNQKKGGGIPFSHDPGGGKSN